LGRPGTPPVNASIGDQYPGGLTLILIFFLVLIVRVCVRAVVVCVLISLLVIRGGVVCDSRSIAIAGPVRGVSH